MYIRVCGIGTCNNSWDVYFTGCGGFSVSFSAAPGLLLVGTGEGSVAPSSSVHLSKGSRAAPVQCDRKVGASSPCFLVTWVPVWLMLQWYWTSSPGCWKLSTAPVPDPCHRGAFVSQIPKKRTLQTSPPNVGSFLCLFPSFLCKLVCWQLVSS